MFWSESFTDSAQQTLKKRRSHLTDILRKITEEIEGTGTTQWISKSELTH